MNFIPSTPNLPEINLSLGEFNKMVKNECLPEHLHYIPIYVRRFVSESIRKAVTSNKVHPRKLKFMSVSGKDPYRGALYNSKRTSKFTSIGYEPGCEIKHSIKLANGRSGKVRGKISFPKLKTNIKVQGSVPWNAYVTRGFVLSKKTNKWQVIEFIGVSAALLRIGI